MIQGDPTGRVYTCNDTGPAVVGQHRDVWFESSDDGYLWWQAVGPVALIEILPE
jgi:3D (Asp-Asp-Asp) domain-containing protein